MIAVTPHDSRQHRFDEQIDRVLPRSIVVSNVEAFVRFQNLDTIAVVETIVVQVIG